MQQMGQGDSGSSCPVQVLVPGVASLRPMLRWGQEVQPTWPPLSQWLCMHLQLLPSHVAALLDPVGNQGAGSLHFQSADLRGKDKKTAAPVQ